MTTPKKLSPAQMRLLKNAATPTGDRTPFLGNRHAGRAAAAWYRTADSLERMGLVTTVREGDASRARATDAGRAILTAPSEARFAEWKRILKDDYLIEPNDTQWTTPEELEKALRGNTVLEFVKWWAEKYDMQTAKEMRGGW
jgi:hypothetical protein